MAFLGEGSRGWRWGWRARAAEVGDPAAYTIQQALRNGDWTPPQRQRLRQLCPGTWQQAAVSVISGWPGHGPGYPVIEIAIYPDVVRLTACSLRAPCR